MSPSLLIGKCPEDSVTKFLHGVVDGIANRPSLDYKTFSDVWSLEEWFEVTEQAASVFTSCVCNQLDKESIYKALDDLQDSYKEFFATVLNIRRTEIETSLKERSVAVSHKHLTDFDWKVKLVLASDKLARVEQPLAALDLHIEGGAAAEAVSLELDKEQLKSLLTSLEAANRAVQQLTSQ